MGLIEWIGAILGGIAINLFASELFAWGPHFSKWLTCWAARRLPVEVRERLQEEWVGHLDSLHPLSRSLAALGFALAACQIRVSFSRKARGMLTLREWLAPKPIIVVVMNEKAATAFARKMSDVLEFGNDASGALDIGPENVVVRSNLMAKARAASRRVCKALLRSNQKELPPTPHDLFERIDAVQAGHFEVERDDLGLEVLDLLETEVSVHGRSDHFDGIVALENFRDQLPHQRGVIDHQHAQTFAHA